MMNNCNALGNVCRLDLLKHFDGTFSEGSALNPAERVFEKNRSLPTVNAEGPAPI